MAERQQQLVFSIIEFLSKSIDDGTVKSDDKEGLEVAIQCIGEAFGVDPSDEEQAKKLSVKPASLQTIFDVYLRTKDKVGPATSSSAASTSQASSKGPSPEDKAKAEKHKQAGNSQMSSKKYDDAIASYDQAIQLDPTNAVYYSNRAAAHSSKGDHLSAIGDAKQALLVDPKFVKAYHRLGHAQYSLGDFKAAASSFEEGLKIDPDNAGLKSGLQNSRSRITSTDSEDVPEETSTSPVPPAAGLGGMADMLRNMGGGGAGGAGAGGMPDLASIMNNPQMMAMAQQMAANGGLANLMQNPALANMMGRVQSGDMPSMEELMADPTLRNLAQQFGGLGQ